MNLSFDVLLCWAQRETAASPGEAQVNVSGYVTQDLGARCALGQIHTHRSRGEPRPAKIFQKRKILCGTVGRRSGCKCVQIHFEAKTNLF